MTARVRGVRAASDRRGRDARGARVDIDGSWNRSNGSDGRRRGHGGERRHEHLVAGTDSGCSEGELQGARAGRHGDALLRSEPLGKFGLERRQLSSQQEAAARRNSFRRCRERRGKALPAPTQVDDRYHG